MRLDASGRLANTKLLKTPQPQGWHDPNHAKSCEAVMPRAEREGVRLQARLSHANE